MTFSTAKLTASVKMSFASSFGIWAEFFWKCLSLKTFISSSVESVRLRAVLAGAAKLKGIISYHYSFSLNHGISRSFLSKHLPGKSPKPDNSTNLSHRMKCELLPSFAPSPQSSQTYRWQVTCHLWAESGGRAGDPSPASLVLCDTRIFPVETWVSLLLRGLKRKVWGTVRRES